MPSQKGFLWFHNIFWVIRYVKCKEEQLNWNVKIKNNSAGGQIDATIKGLIKTAQGL